MIQLNLLPDVKLEYIKMHRMRKVITSFSILVTVVSVGLLIIMLGVGYAQKARIKSISKTIDVKSAQLKSKPGIDEVLTVQNQLNSISALHASKPAVSNLFTYLNEVTPTQDSISSLHVDFTAYTMTITGAADSLSSVNKYVDTLKATQYSSNTVTTPALAFNNVVLTSFALSDSSSQAGQPATYTIDLAYNKDIFDITQKVKLQVPSEVATRSNVGSPTDLFQASATGGN